MKSKNDSKIEKQAKKITEKQMRLQEDGEKNDETL